MILIETIGSVATVLAVAGVVLNNHRLRACFYFWLVSNGPSLVCHVMLGAWSLAVRDGVFWLLAIYGMIAWRRADSSQESSGQKSGLRS